MLFDAQFGDKLLESFIGELHLVNGNQRLRYAKPGEHISFVEMQYVMHHDFGGASASINFVK